MHILYNFKYWEVEASYYLRYILVACIFEEFFFHIVKVFVDL